MAITVRNYNGITNCVNFLAKIQTWLNQEMTPIRHQRVINQFSSKTIVLFQIQKGTKK
jgi:hypothetical protein